MPPRAASSLTLSARLAPRTARAARSRAAAQAAVALEAAAVAPRGRPFARHAELQRPSVDRHRLHGADRGLGLVERFELDEAEAARAVVLRTAHDQNFLDGEARTHEGAADHVLRRRGGEVADVHADGHVLSGA